MSFLNCLTNWSSIASSILVVIVILDKSGFSVVPTVILSILKFLARNRFVILNNTPGLFSTSDEMIYNGLILNSPDSIIYAPVIMSLSPVPGATNGYTSSSGSILMSITVATSVLSALFIAFSNSSID